MKIAVKLLSFSFIIFLFKNWFISGYIIGGDWPFFHNELLREFSYFPLSWVSYQANGLGGQILSYPLDTYLYFIVSLFVNLIGFQWELVYKIFFFGLFILFSIISSRYLLSIVNPSLRKFELLSFTCSLIYTANTFILMTVGGGQMGVALAYSLAPLVLALFLQILKDNKFNFIYSTLAGIALAFETIFDARVAYITLIPVGMYFLFRTKSLFLKENLAKSIRMFLFLFIIPSFVSLLINAFWILPTLIFRSNAAYELTTVRSSVGSFKFFSFANFSQTLSILHPNWPENIFGKVYFMKPEFILLPIIVFSSLFFIISIKEKKESETVLFLAFIALFGAFVAKGANPPFGEVNIWLYNNVPGFLLFRDSTKFYILTIISYSMLIPLSVYKLSQRLGLFLPDKNKKYAYYFCSLIVILYLLFLIRPLVLNRLGGTFVKHQVPEEYISLKNFLNSKTDFYRTLWIPRQQRFGYYSNLHPSVEGMVLFNSSSSAELIKALQRKNSESLLSDLGIRYVIVPYDSMGEIFLRDRKYDEKQHSLIVSELEKLSWLQRLPDFGKIIVFSTKRQKEHFYPEGKGSVSFKTIDTTRYLLRTNSTNPTKIIFSEAYSPYWFMRIDNRIIQSRRSNIGLNTFDTGKSGKYTAEVYFSQQKIYDYGEYISISSFLIVSLFLVGLRLFINKHKLLRN